MTGISALGGLLMIGQFAMTCLSPAEASMVHSVGETRTGITVGMLSVWRHWSNDIPLSAALSFAFPAAVGGFYYNLMIHKDLFVYVVSALGLALLMFMFLEERGPRRMHGNFMWQAIVCDYMVFLVSITGFFGLSVRQRVPRNWKWKLTAALWLLHVGSGLVYLVKILTSSCK